MLLMRGGEHHVHQFVLVLGLHANDVRHATQIGDVEHAMMGWPILRRQSRAIHAEDDRQILQRRVVNDAVVAALQERRINRADRVETHGRHAAREQDGVLFRDADVVVAIRH